MNTGLNQSEYPESESLGPSGAKNETYLNQDYIQANTQTLATSQQRFNVMVAAIFAVFFACMGAATAFYNQRFANLRDAYDNCLDPLLIEKTEGQWIPFWSEPISLYDLYDKVDFNTFKQNWIHNVIPTFGITISSSKDPNASTANDHFGQGNQNAPFVKQVKYNEDKTFNFESCTSITSPTGSPQTLTITYPEKQLFDSI